MRLFPLLLLACVDPPVNSVADADGDGFPANQDCDDGDADSFPGANEYCDGRDNDCDGAIDPPGSWGERDYFVDADRDGWGTTVQRACERPEGTAPAGGDCDDADADRHPRAEEQCNAVDDDCNGVTDDAVVWPDLDGDGFAVEGHTALGCNREGYSRTLGDCDDQRADVFPGATESCNGLDDDCDSLIDDADPTVSGVPIWFPDADEDGFGTDGFSQQICEPGPGWVQVSGDCDDFDALAYPGAPERCDGVDQDCDGVPDGPDAAFSLGGALPLTLTAHETDPVFIEPTLLSVGGDRLVAAFGDCSHGFEVHPARQVEGQVFGFADPVLIVAFQGELRGTVLGQLYLDADPVGVPAVHLTFDEGAATATRDGAVWFDQDFIRSGVATPSGLLALDAPHTAVVDAHPSVTMARFEGQASNASGAIDWTTEWATIAGSQVVYTRSTLEAAPSVLFAPEPFPVRWLALQPSAPFSSSAPLAFGDLTVEVLDGPPHTEILGVPENLQLASPGQTSLTQGVVRLGWDGQDLQRSLVLGAVP